MLSTTSQDESLTLWDPGPEPKFAIDGGPDAVARLVFVPLVEPIRPPMIDDAGYPRYGYPNHIKGETFHTAMGRTISARTKALGHLVRTVHVNACEGARSLADLRRGGKSLAYAAMLFETRAYAALAREEGRVPRVSAVVLTHGEADAENPRYGSELGTYFDEIRDDLRSITGQANGPTFFVTPENAAPARGRDRPLRSTSTAETCRLSAERGDVVCVGPKYDFPYATDRIHLTAVGYRRLGELLGEAYVDTLVRGLAPPSVEAIAASVVGSAVEVRFRVPVPPLGWDTTLGPVHAAKGHPWAKGRGFEVEDDKGRVAITRVNLSATVATLHLARTLTNDAVVRYAMTQDAEGPKGYRGGEPDGRTGELVDSATTEGLDATTVDAIAKHGSATFTGAFAGHGRRDRLAVDGLASGAVIVAHSESEITASSVYTGASGAVKIRIGSDLRHHGVAFEIPLSPPSPSPSE